MSANKKRESHSKYSASFWTQLLVLSERSFLNLYRNPNLMVGHYLTSFCIGTILGLFYYNLDYEDIGAIQNRMGALLIHVRFSGLWLALARLNYLFQKEPYMYTSVRMGSIFRALFSCKDAL